MAVDGTYDVLVETPIGEKRGTATLKATGSDLRADVSIKGLPRVSGTGIVNGQAFSAEGMVKLPLLGKYDYKLQGSVNGELLEATCQTKAGLLTITGVKRG